MMDYEKKSLYEVYLEVALLFTKKGKIELAEKTLETMRSALENLKKEQNAKIFKGM